jgi:hypothetical protein
MRKPLRKIGPLLALLALLQAGPALAGEKLKVAFFGFELIVTSIDPAGEAEQRRIARLSEVFAEMLNASGRYEVVPLTDALRAKVAQSANISGCNGCEIDFAKEAGADIAAFGTVQKVSNLILNENLYMRRVGDGAPYFMRSVDIRGNTDDSWERGLRYLLKNYFLVER